jgi:hypothetical protein
MDNENTTKQSQRVENLEKLVWSVFRALETYITTSELEIQKKHEGEASE